MKFNKLFFIFLSIFSYKIMSSQGPSGFGPEGMGLTQYDIEWELENRRKSQVFDEFKDAIESSDIEAIKKLMPEIKKYNLINQLFIGITPLMWAINKRNLKIVKLLLANEADVNQKNSINETPFLYAISPLNLINDEILDALLDAKGFDVNQKIGEYEVTPLMIMSQALDHKYLKKLIEMGAEVNSKDTLGETALHKAAKKDYLENIKILINAAADVYARNNKGETAKDLANYNIKYPAYGLLTQFENVTNELLKASANGEIKVIDSLLSSGIKVNTKNQFGITALEVAAKNNQLATVKYLLSKGANPNIMDDLKITPLMWAILLTDNVELVEVLLNAGADPEFGKEYALEIAERKIKEVCPNNNYIKIAKLIRNQGNLNEMAKVMKFEESKVGSEQPVQSKTSCIIQ